MPAGAWPPSSFSSRHGSTCGSRSALALLNFPLRVVPALLVIAAVVAIGVWGLVAVRRAKSMSESQRMMAAGGIVVLMAALTAWVIFLWRAYWD